MNNIDLMSDVFQLDDITTTKETGNEEASESGSEDLKKVSPELVKAFDFPTMEEEVETDEVAVKANEEVKDTDEVEIPIEESGQEDQDDDYEEDENLTNRKIYAEFLKEEGLDISLEDEDLTEEKLKEATLQLYTSSVENFIKSKSNAFQDLAAYAFNAEGELDLQQLNTFFNDYVKPVYEDSSEISDREWLTSFYNRNETFPDNEELSEYLDSLNDKDKLSSTRQKLEQNEKENKEKEKDIILAQKEEERKQREIEEQAYLNSLQSEIQALNINKEQQQIVALNLSAAEVARKNQMIVDNPKARVQLAKIYSYFDEEKGEFILPDASSQIEEIKDGLKPTSKFDRKNTDKRKRSKNIKAYRPKLA